ncbi:HAMP domain-containing protein [Paenarthrobacter sp. Z7-10]|nr:HAMP domain-containing protein [Paenarthrobacter sp. Z7-10]
MPGAGAPAAPRTAAVPRTPAVPPTSAAAPRTAAVPPAPSVPPTSAAPSVSAGAPGQTGWEARRRLLQDFLLHRARDFTAWLRRMRTRLVRRWRTSLQFRTVLVTLLVAFLAFAGVGAFLSNQIANGLFQERLQQAKQESSRGMTQVQESFDNAQLSDLPSVSTYVRDTLKLLEAGGADENRKYLMVEIPGQTNSLSVSSSDSGGVTRAIIPAELSTAVQQNSGQFWQSIPLPIGSKDVHPALALGSRVNLLGTDYELYLIYDLNNAQDTLNYIQSVLWLGGGVLLLLIGGIAWYVTHNVVQPVSHAAAVSEKLAAGQLQERMTVNGEDEVARLATSFNKMAASLQVQITQLAMLSQMQQRFVSDVSHELRTPLTTVRMAAEVLYDARGQFDPINKRSAELLYHQVERFQALLADLLEISRFDAGAAVLDAEPRDVFAVVEHVLDGAAPLAEQCGSELSVVSTVPGNSSVADMDPRRIERILRNLVVNALEHGEGRKVEIYVGSNADTVAIAVRDHGIGMTPGEVGRVFDRFWRADPARARTTGGSSGLGLSIATEDTNLHGGRLEAWGEPGNGSCFRLTLPRRSGTALSVSPLQLPPDGGDSGLGGLELHGEPVPADEAAIKSATDVVSGKITL